MWSLANNLYKQTPFRFKSHKISLFSFLYSFRPLTECCVQDVNEAVYLISGNVTKKAPQEALFQLDDPWITYEKDTQPYSLKHFNIVKPSRS